MHPAALDSPSAAASRCVSDQPGAFHASRVVHNGLVDREPSSVTITAISIHTRISQRLPERATSTTGSSTVTRKHRFIPLIIEAMDLLERLIQG